MKVIKNNGFVIMISVSAQIVSSWNWLIVKSGYDVNIFANRLFIII